MFQIDYPYIKLYTLLTKLGTCSSSKSLNPDQVAMVGAGGVQLGPDVTNTILVNAGVLELVIAVGSTTGTWKHFLRYAPLGEDVYVSAA